MNLDKIFVTFANKESLKKNAYYANFLDSCYIFKELISEDEISYKGYYTKILTIDDFKEIGKSEVELLNIALRNMSNSNIFKMVLTNLDNIVMSLSKNKEYDLNIPFSNLPVYVLTDKSYYCGASYILSFKVLNIICQILNTKQMYIIPSTIHEVLIIPDVSEKNKQIAYDAQDIHRDMINGMVEENEKISDKMYYYNYDGQCLTIVK